MSSRMHVNGCDAVINTCAALSGDSLHGLPPGTPVQAHVVDEYPSCPENWMHGSGKASSYFIGLQPGKGMWFDFTQNQNGEYDYAVVISVQGVNPLTGQKMTDLRLEQYKTKCPLHDCDFEQDRFCPECKFKWPAQSYISTTTGETLWLDGFRNELDEVRQYIVTEEEMKRGVAQQMIGEDRVWAIGFAFYRSKEKKPAPPPMARRMYNKGGMGYAATASVKTLSAAPGGDMLESFGGYDDGELGLECCSMDCDTNEAVEEGTRGAVRARGAAKRRSSSKKDQANKKLEVGAGARIDQEIGVDPKDMDFWEEEPVGLIYVNYVTPEKVEEILEGGKREETKEGFLNGVKVGN